MIAKGTKFTVCSHDELYAKGWSQDIGGNYYHKDFPLNTILSTMIQNFKGETLTVDCESFITGWYQVEESSRLWPVGAFINEIIDFSHKCEEGMTPIDGWVICKICGANLRRQT